MGSSSGLISLDDKCFEKDFNNTNEKYDIVFCKAFLFSFNDVFCFNCLSVCAFPNFVFKTAKNKFIYCHQIIKIKLIIIINLVI